MANNYPAITDAVEAFRQNEKRLAHQERRPMVKQASDILGPGIGPFAVEIENWNVPDATFNGFFWTSPGGTGAPDTTHYWIGQTTASEDGFGLQRVFTFHDSAFFPPRQAFRQFYDPGNGNVSFGAWVSGIGLADGDTFSSVGDATGRGAAVINGDGTASINGLATERMDREMGATQNITVGSNTKVRHWTVVNTDTSHFTYDAPTGDFVCNVPGTWLCIATLKFDNTAVENDGVRRLYFDKTPGASFGRGSAISNSVWTDTYVTGTGVATFAVGDALNVMVRTQGADSDLLSGSDTSLQLQRLSA
jgi:hypothetical protein